MKPSRRDILRGAGVAGMAAGTTALPGCEELASGGAHEHPAPSDEGGITVETIAEAEKLQGVSFTASERALMLEELEEKVQTFANLRAIETPNDLAPASIFNPRLPRKRIGSQKNTLAIGGTYDAPIPTGDGRARAIAHASVAQQGVWLRAGAITSAELTEIYLARIAEHDGALNAFVTPIPEIARTQAARADKDFADGRDRGPLHGIPYGLKDLADVKNVRTTWGAAPYKERVSEDDADIVRRLYRAGAVLLGKTTLGAIARGDRWFGGRTNNPWNPKEGSSGSSAGSAAATAAGLCSFAIGTETLGSLISPSERCGVATVRPTFGRISRAGLMALAWSLDKVGPLCRSVEDTALVLSVLNGYDADDPATARVGFSYDGKATLSDMTVGYVPAWFDDEGDETDRAALAALKGLGVAVKEITWPDVDFASLRQIVAVESAAAFADLTLTDRDDELTRQGENAWPNTWRAARFVSAVDYVQMDRLRRKLMADVGALFDDVDAIIGPNFAGGALLATNMTGHPQLAFRAGFTQRTARGGDDENSAGETFRAPRNVSLWGDLFQEGKLIALGAALEETLRAHAETPPGF
ncbi:MAG: amidase [Pseudomonadota bacterium]